MPRVNQILFRDRAPLLGGLVFWGLLQVGACAESTKEQIPTPGVSNTQGMVEQGQEGYEMGVQAMACWFGALWSDAEGNPAPKRREVTERHCRDAARLIYGGDVGQLGRIRAMDPTVVDEVARRVAERSGAQGAALQQLLQAVAAAEREARAARAAAAQVKKDLHDLNDPNEATQLDPEEIAMVATLRTHAALEALLKVQGPLAADAHALGILVAIDRVQTARSLPRRLRLYAMEGPSRAVFGLYDDHLAADPTQRLPKGAWLLHLSEIAREAGYPVPEQVQARAEQAMMAWNGIFKGFADRLRKDQGALSPLAPPSLRRVIAIAIRELDHDYEEARKAARLKP
jgi:hypothetical protein